jgi:hypothetical protein
MKMFLAKENGPYQILNNHSNLEEIIEPMEQILYNFKSITFKKIDKEMENINIGSIKINTSKEVKIKEIKISSNNLIPIQPERTIFTLNSEKIRIITLLKVKL